MSQKLFDDSDDGEGDDLQLGTNEGYAKSYNSFRKKELLKKYKDRGYDVEESDFSNESETSSEDEIDPKFDEEFFKTLASLKSKDPAIYNKDTHFFEGLANDDVGDDNDDSKTKKSKPVTIKDYERHIILEKGGKFEDDTDEDVENEKQERAASPTVVEEERRLKAEFKNVLNADDSEEEEFGGIFKKREKTKEEKAQDEADFTKWLAGKQADIETKHKEKLEPLKNYWNSRNLPQSERFLRDYILNQGYANAKTTEIPTYDEIVGDNMPLSEDEAELEKQAEFEHKYNFRFEEPDSEFIQRYPRTIENSVRRTDDKRKEKRQELKQRKQLEKEQKMKEFEMIKEMKRKEIQEKIRKLKAVTGNDELGFKDEELEDDFDPEEHDRRMQEIFNEDYYQVDEGEDKPECPSDIEELKIEDWDNYDPHRGDGAEDDYDLHCEDDDFNMDCDYDPSTAKQELQKELIENTKGRRGRRGRRNRFMEMIQSEKPAFDPEDEKTYGDYIDEYYKLDCEDVIGDLPCRFKYVETTPNDFGLTIEEILLAKNKELNQWASLKKAIQIRPLQTEKKDQRLYKMKAKNEDLKRKIFKSLYGDGSDDEDMKEVETELTKQQDTEQKTNDATTSSQPNKKSNKKKKRKAQAAIILNESAGDEQLNTANQTETHPKKQKVDETKADAEPKVETDDTKKPVPENKKKKKNKKKKNQSENSVNTTADSSQTTSTTIKSPAAISNHKNPFNKQIQIKAQTTNGEKMQSVSKTATVTNSNSKNPFVMAQPETATQNNTEKEKSVTTTNSNSKNPFTRSPKKVAEVRHQSPRKSFGHGVQNKFRTKFKPKFNGKPIHKSAAKKSAENGQISDDRLKAYGINPRKFHKKQKFANKQK